jgi:hypothetical protein
MQTLNLQTWPASNRVLVTSILDTGENSNVPELPQGVKNGTTETPFTYTRISAPHAKTLTTAGDIPGKPAKEPPIN